MDNIQISDLPKLSDFGFSGGRNSIKPFAQQVFRDDGPRFLRSEEGDLVVLRNKDLQAMGAMPQVGDVPPLVMFGPVYEALVAGQPILGSNLADVIANQIFTTNPPIHRPLRKAFVSRLGPKQVKAMEATAREVAKSILDEADLSDRIDALDHFAERVTCRFWGDVLGMTEAEIDEMEPLIRDFTPIFYLERSLEDAERFDRAVGLYKALLERVAERGLQSGNEFITLLSAELDDVRSLGLPEDPACAGIIPSHVGAMLAGNLVDAYHTAAVGIANVLFVLSQEPEVVALIASDRSLLLPAVFEALRIAPPVIALKRWALEDFELDGLFVPAGTSIVMMWGMGGYDPAQFDRPDRFVLDRSRQGSTTFGGGLHICPGRYLAPMLAQILCSEIFDRGLTFDFDTVNASWIEGTLLSQLTELNLRLRRA